MDDVRKIRCKCGGVKGQVINTEERARMGWYCPDCKAWEKAIGRERTWIPC